MKDILKMVTASLLSGLITWAVTFDWATEVIVKKDEIIETKDYELDEQYKKLKSFFDMYPNSDPYFCSKTNRQMLKPCIIP